MHDGKIVLPPPESIRYDAGRHARASICSNQAMIWDCLRVAGIDDRFDGFGRLLSDH